MWIPSIILHNFFSLCLFYLIICAQVLHIFRYSAKDTEGLLQVWCPLLHEYHRHRWQSKNVFIIKSVNKLDVIFLDPVLSESCSCRESDFLSSGHKEYFIFVLKVFNTKGPTLLMTPSIPVCSIQYNKSILSSYLHFIDPVSKAFICLEGSSLGSLHRHEGFLQSLRSLENA